MASPHITRRTVIANATVAGAALGYDAEPAVAGNDALLERLCESHARELHRLNTYAGDLRDDACEYLNGLEDRIAGTSAQTMRGVTVKAAWLRDPHNYNNGCLGAEYANGKVFLSLLDDIARLSAN